MREVSINDGLSVLKSSRNHGTQPSQCQKDAREKAFCSKFPLLSVSLLSLWSLCISSLSTGQRDMSKRKPLKEINKSVCSFVVKVNAILII